MRDAALVIRGRLCFFFLFRAGVLVCGCAAVLVVRFEQEESRLAAAFGLWNKMANGQMTAAVVA